MIDIILGGIILIQCKVGIIIFSSIVSLTGTMLGALLGISMKNPSKKLLGITIGFSGGLMFCITILELIPEAVSKISIINAMIFIILGILIMFLIDNIRKSYNNNNYSYIAFFVALGIMLHNFPEGIIMGFGFSAGDNLGLKMSLLISIHDIPEGIAVATPLMVVKTNRYKILFYTFLTALPTALGAWIGIFIGSNFSYILGNCLSMAAGIMLYVVCGKMFFESKELCGSKNCTKGILLGVIFGIIIIGII